MNLFSELPTHGRPAASGEATELTPIQRLMELPRILRLHLAAKAAATDSDGAHDLSHSLRVLANALVIAESEGGEPELLAAAALLHDIANLPKNHPEARLSSERSAEAARRLLVAEGFTPSQVERVCDAILCHSFSRGQAPGTLEGRVFQDADRLDALGAIGIARCFATGGGFGARLYHADDPFLRTERAPDDKTYSVDHFFTKLFALGERMQTLTGFRLAKSRIERMKRYLAELEDEIHGHHGD
ncbi:MAG: HD domain-containing protein [Bdellovibrionales bacterium]|nr:HD domain-containing protein [Bdellovibrionales bacterium]